MAHYYPPLYYSPALQATSHPPHRYIGMSLANTPMPPISRPMPQQPLRPLRSRQVDRKKRHGVIFTTNPLEGAFESDGDGDSSWSMSRSRMPRRMPTRRPVGVRNRNSSPAQEIAARYRASHSSDDRSRTCASSSVTYLDAPSADTLYYGTSIDTDLSSASGPRLRFRESRATAMDNAAREAYVMAIRCESDRDIPCQRPGCRDILPNMRSLASHLAIHDLEPAERYGAGYRYQSFLDLGHSVAGHQRKRYAPSPFPYARSVRKRSKMRKYLSMLTCHSIGCIPRDNDLEY